VVAQHTILFGARCRRKTGFFAVQADERMSILDRGTVGKKRGWQVHRLPGP
jgi:hypothetical protein